MSSFIIPLLTTRWALFPWNLPATSLSQSQIIRKNGVEEKSIVINLRQIQRREDWESSTDHIGITPVPPLSLSLSLFSCHIIICRRTLRAFTCEFLLNYSRIAAAASPQSADNPTLSSHHTVTLTWITLLVCSVREILSFQHNLIRGWEAHRTEAGEFIFWCTWKSIKFQQYIDYIALNTWISSQMCELGYIQSKSIINNKQYHYRCSGNNTIVRESYLSSIFY